MCHQRMYITASVPCHLVFPLRRSHSRASPGGRDSPEPRPSSSGSFSKAGPKEGLAARLVQRSRASMDMVRAALSMSGRAREPGPTSPLARAAGAASAGHLSRTDSFVRLIAGMHEEGAPVMRSRRTSIDSAKNVSVAVVWGDVG